VSFDHRQFTTGVGSLPFEDPEKAIEHVFTKYTLPFLPELPRMIGKKSSIPPMLYSVCSPRLRQAIGANQTQDFFREWERWSESAAEAEETLQSWSLLSPFANRAKSSNQIKVQMAGPDTFSTFLQTLGGQSREVAEKFSWAWVQTLSQALVAKLTPLVLGRIYFFWDEPTLGSGATLGGGERYLGLRGGVPSKRVAYGLHCCGVIDFCTLSRHAHRMYAGFDVYAGKIDLDELVPDACHHLDQGGGLALGLVDTKADHINIESTIGRARPFLAKLATSPNFTEVLLTGGCGTGLKTVAFEEALAETLRTIGALSMVS
jgi:hypothetical protein